MHVLIIEADTALAVDMVRAVQARGWSADSAASSAAARALLASVSSDAIVVDAALADGPGLALCAEIRASGFTGPILLLALEADTAAILDGLAKGCTDYLLRPFDMELFVRRLHDALRRSGDAAPLIRIGEVTIERRTRTVAASGRRAALTRREYDLLEFLARHRGESFDRRTIARLAWTEDGETRHPHEVDAMVTSLRRRLGRDMIEVVTGQGYRVPADVAPQDSRTALMSGVQAESSRSSNVRDPEFMQ
ncbi:MAG: response regulator transcription factor [Coriobacteriia bacterium]|nr:response regulator transcription factor [Coriobacteriia bacterium]